MRLGLATPVVTLNPRAHGSWEADAGLDELVSVAEAADRLGYDHLTCSEHVVVPRQAVERRGGRYWDPLATFGYRAARTDRIRLATYVLVLGYHHPLEIAKRYGTLDRITGGRLVLGVGVGSLEEEFELLGADFDGRGDRADDALAALRASFGAAEPSYHGTHYDFDGFVVDPTAVQERVPIWIGGRTARSLRRAVELGDGWAPFAVPVDQLAEWVRRCRETPAWERREAPLELVLHPARWVDPIGEPEATADAVGRTVDAGATMLNLRFRHDSLGECLDQMEAMAQAFL